MTPLQRQAANEGARRRFAAFVKLCNPQTEVTEFHFTYYRILQAFAEGKIKKLIISVPPQHGKSFGATINLPAYMFGMNPDLKAGIASYSATYAERLNRNLQRQIDSPAYGSIFPNSFINSKNIVTTQSWLRNSTEFEIVNHKGFMKAVGRGSGLTGTPIDCMFMDDLYKDSLEANSATIRDGAWEWYTSVVRTRLHNNSQQLIVFTRWHEDDIIGRLMAVEPYIAIETFDDLENIPDDTWAVLNFEAIKEGEPTEIDPRLPGQVLWEERHSLKSLEEKRNLDPAGFGSLYQGNPCPREGLLYENGFREYEFLPDDKGAKKKAVTDTADTGSDFFGTLFYIETKTAIYVTDVLFTQKNTDYTEPKCAQMLTANGTELSLVESNNGGRSICKAIKEHCIKGGNLATKFQTFPQTKDKEARIRLNAPAAQNIILFPKGWEKRWSEFASQLKSHRYVNAYNKHDDAADIVTLAVENFNKKTNNFIIL